MFGIDDHVSRQAAQYTVRYGADAARQVAAEVRNAARREDWEAVRTLERVRLRLRRAQLCDQIRARLELSRMRIA